MIDTTMDYQRLESEHGAGVYGLRGITWVRGAGATVWDAAGRETISIAAGTLDDHAGLRVAGHIYVSERATYYERWLYSLELLLREKGLLAAGELDARADGR